MIEKIQHATASSPEGAKGLVKGVLACAFQNMAFMLPTGLLYLLVKDLLAGSTSGRSTFYLVGCVACFVLILLTTWFQYNGTYFTTYKESGTRRLTLAERLRKLPLSFFGKRDLADLTSTIMADCEVLEKDCSHFIPGLFGSLISTVLIALSLFAFEWRMALAALWVIPVSAAIVVGSYRVQDKVQARTMAAKMACADGIQEYIETLRDLKASNAEQRYLSGLSDKIRAVEKQSIVAELETALFVSSAGMVLKLGIASVALTGSVLLVQGGMDDIGDPKIVEELALRLNAQRHVDVDFAMIEEGDHMYNGHLVDLYKVVGNYVISALSKKAPAKKRRGRRKKSEIAEQMLLEGQTADEEDDELLDDEDDDFDDDDEFIDGDDFADDEK